MTTTDQELPREVLHPTAGRARQHNIRHDGPAPGFFDGALLGNGGLGVVVTTRPDAVVLRLGHNEVWDQRVDESHADRIGTFAEVWERLRSLGPDVAALTDDPWFADYVAEMAVPYARPYPRPFPCGSLVLGLDRRRVEVLGHELDLADGTCRVHLLTVDGPGTLEVSCDQEFDRVWLRWLGADGRPAPAPLDRIRLLPDPDGLTVEGPTASLAEQAVSTTVAGDRIDLDRLVTSWSEEERALSFTQRLPALESGAADPRDRTLQVRLQTSNRLTPGTRPGWYGHREPFPPLERAVAADGPFRAVVSLVQEGPDKAVAETTVAATEAGWRAAVTAGQRNWADYWSRSAVELGQTELERAWYRNTYFLHCTLRAGRTCPGLFGNWSYRGIGTAWHGDYHMNYNTQQVFWGVFSSNRVEQHVPYVDLVDHLTPLASAWAEDYYGLRGACFPHSAYPVAMTTNPYPVPTWGWEICETPWTVQSLWWHYRYTLDLDFLRDRAFTPIRAATLFLVDYLSRPDARHPAWDDDRYHVVPTVVPEVYGLTPGLQMNADGLADLTLIRFVLDAYGDAVRALGTEAAEEALLTRAADVLDHLPPLPTADTPDGPVLVAAPGEDPDVVHNVPVSLMSVFPGEEHGLHSPAALLETLVRTLHREPLEGGNELVFANLQAARLGQLDLERFARQIHYCQLPNGTCTDMVLQANGRYADTTDFDFMAGMGIWVENFAVTAVVNECLLQSYTGVLRLFPNWPSEVDAEFSTLRATGAFLVSAAQRAGRIERIEVFSESGGILRLLVPWTDGAACSRAGHQWTLPGGEVAVPTEPGDVLVLTAVDDLVAAGARAG